MQIPFPEQLTVSRLTPNFLPCPSFQEEVYAMSRHSFYFLLSLLLSIEVIDCKETIFCRISLLFFRKNQLTNSGLPPGYTLCSLYAHVNNYVHLLST